MPGDKRTAEAPLDSWKAIADYLKRDVRTVMRWEKSERLPGRTMSSVSVRLTACGVTVCVALLMSVEVWVMQNFLSTVSASK